MIIVGAGPSGLIAGYFAAEAGAKVLILDKKKELGKPVRCAEAVIQNVFQDFNIKPKKEMISNYVNTMKLISSKGKIISLKLNIDGYILDRVKFEDHLGFRAKKKGAKIQLRTTVLGLKNNELSITRDNGKTTEIIKGKIIIGADGVESRIGRWVGINSALKPQDIAVCFQYLLDNIEVDKNTVEFYWGREYSPHGYIWVFPKSDSSANVGIVTAGSKKKNLINDLETFISSRAPAGEKLKKVAGCVPQARPPKNVVRDNVMLVGDAARVSIPVTGAGIGHALITGKWAGTIAGEIIANNLNISELDQYDKKLNKIRKKIARSYRLYQKIIRDDDIFELLIGFFIPFQYIYKLSPKFVERYLLKSFRY